MRRSAFSILAGVILAIAGAAVVLHAFGVPLTVLGVAAFALPAALVLIWLAEARRIRGLVFWVLAGAALGGAGYLALNHTYFENRNALLALLGSGALGGWVYWAIAGKRSGALAAAIDKSGQAADFSEPRLRRRCWACTALMLLVGLIPLALIGTHVLQGPDATWPQAMTDDAQATGTKQFADAGWPWASLKIENHVGHVTGTAPDADARTAAFAKANALLAPMVGLPGVVAYLQNDMTVVEPVGPTLAEQVLAAVEQERIAAEAKRKTAKKSAKDRARDEKRRAAEAKRKAEEQAAADAKARALEEERRVAEAKRKADEEAAAIAAAKARALEEERLAAEAQRKTEDEKRLALEAEREKNAVAAARKAEADEAEAGKGQNAPAPQAAAPPAPPPPPASTCDSDFAELFKSTTIQFASRATGLDPKLSAFLDSAAALSKRCTDYAIDIAGHADRTGTKALNLATSLARAVAVRDVLVSRGVPNDRLMATGYGDSRPLNPARNRAAFERNRRVELSARRIGPSPSPVDQAAVLTRPDVKPFNPAACHTRLTRAVGAAHIRFAVRSTRVRRSTANDIRVIARVLRRCPSHTLTINGHADRRGTIEANRPLSENRAVAVRDLLIARGVPADRLLTIGHGALMPKATGASLADHARNRRVDFDVSATAAPDSR